MLTLKVIHTEFEGGRITHLFAGERISHVEIESTNHRDEFISDKDFFQIGKFTNPCSIQPYVTSTVTIFDGNDYQTIQILPKSECFIMSNGKTVDSFSSYYK